MKISIAGIDYEITDITPISGSVLKITFVKEIPIKFGDITTYTNGGIIAGTLIGYYTLYRLKDKELYLSNDGSRYVESTGTINEPINEGSLTDIKCAKKEEISYTCKQIIYNGIDVTLTDGSTEHFSLTETDQLNLFGKQVQIAAGSTSLEYHADGQSCRYYSSNDILRIIDDAIKFVSYQTTYCNSMYMWILGCETIGEVKAIAYGDDIPEQYQTEVLKSYLVTGE